ncbi:hypothetical protein B0H67DRAFT_155672 [Lasiosphaeris hirsuta]|uniref:Uncharacterized protein n=1 Tax=Lasiosphaeris hirsuta TaxID=260670 RepID=A0AA40APD0_9PEZI|nr:hypothetical protein B0H67DRAFT_155672 [Lasiosphaeris hirsuta]
MSGVGFAWIGAAPRLLSMPPIIHAILGQCNGVPGVGSCVGGRQLRMVHGAMVPAGVASPIHVPLQMCPVLLRIRTALYIIPGELPLPCAAFLETLKTSGKLLHPTTRTLMAFKLIVGGMGWVSPTQEDMAPKETSGVDKCRASKWARASSFASYRI